MGRKFFRRCLAIVLAGSVVFAGCGKKNALSESTEVSDSIDYEAAYREEEVNDVLADEWSRDEEGETEAFMTLSEYHSGVFKDNERGERYYRGCFADNKYIYSLDTYYDHNGDFWTSTFLSRVDISDRSVSVTDYGYCYSGMVADPFSVGGRIFATSEGPESEEVEDDEVRRCRIVEFLPDGETTEMADVTDVLDEHGLIPEDIYQIVDAKLVYEPATGDTYILPPTENFIVAADENGHEITTFKGFSNEGSIKLSYYAATSDGHLIFMEVSGKNEAFFIFENGEPKVLHEGETGPEAMGEHMLIDGHGRILFMAGTGSCSIYSWDIKEGTQEKLYTEGVDGERFGLVDTFARNENGELLIFYDNDLKVLSLSGPAKTVEISLQPMTTTGYTLKSAIKSYEGRHPGVKFNILKEAAPSNHDTELNRVYTEMARGEGPDIIFLNDSDMHTLAKSDCLYEMSDVLRDDVKNKLLPAVYDNGRFEGGKYKMGFEPSLRTMIINKKYCKEEAWSATDIVNIVEEREKAGDPFEWLACGNSYDGNSLILFMGKICESEFVDLDAHTCDFDSETFVKLLNICKMYDDKDIKRMGDSYKLMKEDKALIYIDYMMTFSQFSEDLNRLGDDYRIIGYPTVKGNGNILIMSMGVSVNKATVERDPDKKEVIVDFLNWLYSPDLISDSFTGTIPTRIDAFDGKVKTPADTNWLDSPAVRLDAYTWCPLPGKTDGSSYLEEYKELLMSLENYSSTGTDREVIQDIIYEEAQPFFEGAKSAEEVAKIIQNRVMIYLMETK